MSTMHAEQMGARPQETEGGRRIAGWIVTGLFAAMMIVSGALFLSGKPEVAAMLRELGYPDYFRSLLGVAKVLGALALLMPRPSILREWAYAGFTFDLLGALASHALHGDAAAHLAPALITLGLLVASYVLRRRAHSEGGGR